MTLLLRLQKQERFFLIKSSGEKNEILPNVFSVSSVCIVVRVVRRVVVVVVVSIVSIGIVSIVSWEAGRRLLSMESQVNLNLSIFQLYLKI